MVIFLYISDIKYLCVHVCVCALLRAFLCVCVLKHLKNISVELSI